MFTPQLIILSCRGSHGVVGRLYFSMLIFGASIISSIVQDIKRCCGVSKSSVRTGFGGVYGKLWINGWEPVLYAGASLVEKVNPGRVMTPDRLNHIPSSTMYLYRISNCRTTLTSLSMESLWGYILYFLISPLVYLGVHSKCEASWRLLL